LLRMRRGAATKEQLVYCGILLQHKENREIFISEIRQKSVPGNTGKHSKTRQTNIFLEHVQTSAEHRLTSILTLTTNTDIVV